MDCDICSEKFSKIPSRKQAKCPYCDIKACVKCVQTYLIGTHEDPHCMGCRKGWSREVLDSFALITWIDGDYKHHRQNILVDREKSRLPAAQIIIEGMKEAEERRPGLHALLLKTQEIYSQYLVASKNYEDEKTIVDNLARGILPSTIAEKQEKRVFVMPCPASTCRGFLSSAYKCGVCNIHVCSECREIKGVNRDSDHTCDPNVVATVQAMKKECRPCPECGTNIFRISGCSQMFCTQCHTGFDWGNGRKITKGVVHNPHYFEYIAKLNNGNIPRRPGDIPCGNNIPSAWEFDRVIRRMRIQPATTEIRNVVYVALNTFTHLQHYEIPQLINNAEDMDNTKNNIMYLKNEITELKWKQNLQNREKRRMRRDEIRQRIEAFCGAASDVYGTFMTQTRDNPEIIEKSVITLYEQIMKLKSMFNHEMLSISYRYKCQVIKILDSYNRDVQKAERGKKPDDISESSSVSSKKKLVIKKKKKTGSNETA